MSDSPQIVWNYCASSRPVRGETTINEELELCWGISPNASIEDLAVAAGKHGFTSLTISPAHYYQARAKGLTDAHVRRILTDAGVVVSTLDPLASAMPGAKSRVEIPESYLERLRFSEVDFYRAAHAIGASTLNLANRFCNPVSLSELIDGIGAVADRAFSEGLHLVVEFNPDSSVPDLSTAENIVAAIGADKVGIMLDSWHFARTGGTIGDLRRLPVRFVGGLQISDRKPPAPGEPYIPMSGRLMPGQGVLPLAEMLTIILDHNPGIRVGAEVLNDALRAAPLMEAVGLIALSFSKLLLQVRSLESADNGNSG